MRVFGYGVVHVSAGALRDLKGVLDPLELALWTVLTVVSLLIQVLGTGHVPFKSSTGS